MRGVCLYVCPLCVCVLGFFFAMCFWFCVCVLGFVWCVYVYYCSLHCVRGVCVLCGVCVVQCVWLSYRMLGCIAECLEDLCNFPSRSQVHPEARSRTSGGQTDNTAERERERESVCVCKSEIMCV